MKIGIIGGGINGFSCGVKIQERFKQKNLSAEVTIISDDFSPNTTGDGSAGLWGPYLLGKTSAAKVHKWSKGMHDFLQEIWLSDDAGEAGICLLPIIRVTTIEQPIEDFWKDIVYGFQTVSKTDLDDLNREMKTKYKSAVKFVTYTSEPIKLLPYLMKRFSSNGGKILNQKIEDFEYFLKSSSFDAVINCTGLGSKNLLKDKKMFPVRGQVSRVKANWLYYCILDESDVGHYIIPNCDTVVLGGTHQEHDYNTNVCSVDKQFILKGCHDIVPGLKHAQHQFDWVGLRPGRGEIRLEAELRNNKILIHNYGHGGSGVTLAWGCAEDVLKILEEEMEKQNVVKSKL